MCQLNIDTAKRIMGANFIGPKDITQHSNICLSSEDFDFFSDIPYPAEILEQRQNSHILISGLKLSVLDTYLKVPDIRPYFDSDPWWIREPFAQNIRMKRQWYLIRKNVLSESLGRSFEEQLKMAAEAGEVVPFACELIFTLVFYHLVAKIPLLEKTKAYCKDTVIYDVPFFVGFFPPKGHIDIRGYAEGGNKENVGIISMQALEAKEKVLELEGIVVPV